MVSFRSDSPEYLPWVVGIVAECVSPVLFLIGKKTQTPPGREHCYFGKWKLGRGELGGGAHVMKAFAVGHEGLLPQ